MGMPGIREEVQVNPYLQKHMPVDIPSGGKGKVIAKGEKKYDLGSSNIKGGIFGPPDTSAIRGGGKAVKYNPASGTYTTNRPY